MTRPYRIQTALLAAIVAVFTMAGQVRAEGQAVTEFKVPKQTSSPHSIAVDPSGDVWFAEKVGRNLTVFNPADNHFTVHALPSDWGNVGPSRIAMGPRGNIWFSVRRWADSDDDIGFIGQFQPATATFRKHKLARTSPGGLRVDWSDVTPEDLLVETSGVLWFLSPGKNKLFRFEPGGSGLQGFTIPSPNSYPKGIDMDANGDIWFTEANANKIAKFSQATKTFSEYVIPTAFSNPETLSIDQKGRVWFVEMRTNRISVFYPDMERFDTIQLPTSGGQPSALGVDGDGNIWFVEYMGNKVGVFHVREARFEEFDIPTPGSQPGDMAIDLKRHRLWFSETNTEAKNLGMLPIKSSEQAREQAQ